MAETVGDAVAGGTARPPWQEATKGLAMFMVVAFHATLYLQSVGVDAVLGRAKAAFELFPMPAFFLLAGIVATRHARYSFRALWRHRLLPLLYLYVLWSVLRTAFYVLVPGLNGELGELPATDPHALPLILLWPSSSYWFLYALFLFTFFRWLIADLPGWLQLAASASVSTLVTTGVVETGNLGWNRVGALFFFYVLGALFAPRIRELATRARPVHCWSALAVFVAVSALLLLGLRWVPLLVLTGQIAAVAVGILGCARLAGSRLVAPLAVLGRSSLKVYLLQLYVIVPAVALIGLADPAWPRWFDVVVQLALTAIALAGSLALARASAGVRWLYLPPAFLRNARPFGGAAQVAPVLGRHRSAECRDGAGRDSSGAVGPVAPSHVLTRRKELA